MDINIILCKYVCTLHIMLCQLRVTFFARLKKYYLVYFRKKESNRTWVHILTNHRGSNFQDGKMLEGWNYVEMCVLKRCAALLLLPHFCKNPVWKITDNNIAQAARFVYKNPSDGSCPLLYFLTNLCWTQKMPLFWIMIKKSLNASNKTFFVKWSQQVKFCKKKCNN